MRPGGDFEHATDWAGKAPGAAARLAAVLHGIEHAHGEPWAHRIARETMERALTFMAVTARHTLAAYDFMGSDDGTEAARRVWGWIERGRRASFTAREAWQGMKGSFPRMADLITAFGVLEERGYLTVTEERTGGRGRPSQRVTVRPHIVEGWA